MKAVKLNKRLLNMHPADLLIKLGAVNKEQTLVFPQHVYFSKQDYKTLKENLRNYAKKKISPGRLLDYSVNMDMLNYGPNESLRDAIVPGVALIDWESINAEEA